MRWPASSTTSKRCANSAVTARRSSTSPATASRRWATGRCQRRRGGRSRLRWHRSRSLSPLRPGKWRSRPSLSSKKRRRRRPRSRPPAREVFLEESAEEIDNLDRLLPLWRAEPDSLERLAPVRRVFHTLKGSGRLVGASKLGEFSWKVEHMLNQVRDGKRAASPAVVAMVDRAFYTLPELLAALRGEAGLTTDLSVLQDAAGRIAAGDETMPPEVTAPGPSAVEAEPGAPVEAPVEEALAAVDLAEAGQRLTAVPAKLDALLLEILDAEVNGHLQTVDAWVAAARGG